ncbi:MAG: metallophosphoesterase family protein, partial [Victivallales bacterium]|nr:metallophosphoesterase family protein [Victivallales bacterium]
MTKIGFFSDVHANYEALIAVLAKCDELKCDELICLGDVVGYGASPTECIKLLRERDIPCVLGNHDEYVSTIMNPEIDALRPEIRHSIDWTQAQLSLDDLKWLGSQPMQLQVIEDLICLHASFARHRWSYCLDEVSFKSNFALQPCQLAFCGHSHSPLIGIDLPDQQYPFVDFIRTYTIPNDKKVMVNVGSVGQPRDGDPRASYV